MEDKTDKIKTPWNDIAKVWARIASIITASGISATVMVKVFNLSPELIYSVFIGLGLILLIISLYVDKQAEYTHQEIIKYEQKARQDFSKSLEEMRTIVKQNREDTERRVDTFKDDVKVLINNTLETRKDTTRIQLIMVMHNDPDNIDTILKLAEKYFIELHGDWYMTSEFTKWAKSKDVIIPNHIYDAIDNNHKNNWK